MGWSIKKLVALERRRKMQIQFDKKDGLLIYFPPNELKFALAVLRGINKVVNLSFVQQCADDIEAHLKPKKLPMINYFHVCVHCTRSIDERDDNTMCITKEGDTRWKCRVCKPLKKDRPQ